MATVPAHVAESAGWLRGVVAQLHRRLRQVDNSDSLTPSQSAALNRLYREGPATQGELAAAARGSLARARAPADGRRTVLSVSELGAKTVQGIRQHRDEWLAHALAAELT